MKRSISILSIIAFLIIAIASSTKGDTCYRCDGKGELKCWVCGGDGLTDNGGELDNGNCYSCGGDGIAKCTTCRATGKMQD